MQEELYLSFENFLNNELSLEDKNAFKNQLQNDIDFKNQFELYKEATKFLEAKFSTGTIDFRENLKSISENHFSAATKKETKVISLSSKWFAIAAILVLSIGVWFMNSGGNPSYSEFNQHENANFIERGSVIKELKLAQDAFNNKAYEEAVVLFEKVLVENKSPEVEIFYGISLLEINETSNAETVFKNLKNGKSVYNQKAIWYLALTNLKLKEFEACENYLKEISKDSEEYEKAQKLLNELD